MDLLGWVASGAAFIAAALLLFRPTLLPTVSVQRIPIQRLPAASKATVGLVAVLLVAIVVALLYVLLSSRTTDPVRTATATALGALAAAIVGAIVTGPKET